MPINTTHPDYNAYKNHWKEMRDVLNGEDAVKKATIKYLPKPASYDYDEVKGVDTDRGEYEAYLKRASFKDVPEKTVIGLRGGIFRKQPVVRLPKKIEYLDDNADGKNNSISQLGQCAAYEVLGVGRCGLLADYPAIDNSASTAADDAVQSNRAQVNLYAAESIVNWQFQRIDSDYKLSRLVLFEEVPEEDPKDEYAPEMIYQWRELFLENNAAYVRVWRSAEKESKVEFVLHEEPSPLIDYKGEPFREIPFVFLGSKDLTATITRSPINGIAKIALSQYRNTADYEEGLFNSGQPTTWVSNLTPQWAKDHQFYMGSKSAWSLPKDAQAGTLQLSAELERLETAIKDKNHEMLLLGAKLVEQKEGGVEATETIRLKQSAEISVLTNIANNLSEAVTMCVRWCSRWMHEGDPDEAEVFFNNEFYTSKLTPEEIAAQITLRDSRAITMEMFFDNLVKGGHIPETITFDEYMAALEEEAPETDAPNFDDDEDDLESDDSDADDDADESDDTEEN